MQYAPGTYFCKDRYSQRYVLVVDGQRVGEVATRKEARKWWEAITRVGGK